MSGKCIAVAVEGAIGDWAAYIDGVPGEDFNEEWKLVRDHGQKLPREVAEVLFPDFKKLTWRD